MLNEEVGVIKGEMTMRGVLIALIILMTPVQANAQELDMYRSDTWLSLCEVDVDQCHLYIMGTINGVWSMVQLINSSSVISEETKKHVAALR